MKIVYSTLYLLKDSHGNMTSTVAEDSSNTVQICGMKDADGKDAYFESSAYHLGTFCDTNKIELKVIKREEDFDKLWEEAK